MRGLDIRRRSEALSGGLKKGGGYRCGVKPAYLRIAVFRRATDFNANVWGIVWSVKNYETLPASEVQVEIVVDRDGRGEFIRDTACRGWELLPKADLEGSVATKIDRTKCDALSRGEPAEAAHLNVTYQSLAAAGFGHSADFSYDPTTQNVKPRRSQTRPFSG